MMLVPEIMCHPPSHVVISSVLCILLTSDHLQVRSPPGTFIIRGPGHILMTKCAKYGTWMK